MGLIYQQDLFLRGKIYEGVGLPPLQVLLGPHT